MKKKILYLATIVVLGGLLFVLTGCGEPGYQTYQALAQEKVQVERPTIEQQQPIQDVSATLSGRISNVITSFTEDNDEAVVRLNGSSMSTEFVINESGNILYTINSSTEYSNGYTFSSTGGTITDLKTNKEIAKNTTEVTCVGVTKSGYVLQNVEKEELAGKVYKSQIIDTNGRVTWSHENKSSKPEYFKAVKDDYVIYLTNTYSNQKYTIINAKTGKEIETGYCSVAGYFEYKIKGDYLLIGISANNDYYSIFNTRTEELTNTKLSHIHKILNDKYVYATPLWGTVGIYDMEGNLVKDLDEGKVKEIYYYNNKYYVISETDFYYTLDETFKYVDEPVKISSVYNEIRPTKYGIYFKIGDSDTDYYSSSSTKSKKIDASSVLSDDSSDKQYFIAEDDFKANEDVTSKATLVSGLIDFQEEVGESAFARISTGNYCLINLRNAQIININR